MKRKFHFLILVFAFVFMLALIGCGTETGPATPEQSGESGESGESSEPGEVIRLTASCYLPPAHMLSEMMGEMLEKIEEQSGGRLDIDYSAGGSILTAPATADGVEEGLADIGLSHTGYTPGRFPVTEALSLPIGYPSSWVGTNVATDFLEKYQPSEWDNFEVLLVNGGTTASINMSKSPIRTMEDFSGKTMRGAGEVADALRALGAAPRDVPMAEVYDAMSKGTIDGLMVGAESLKSFRIAEVTEYATYAPCVGNQYLFYIAMNKDKWNSLPDDIKQIFKDVSAEYQFKSAVGWNLINIEGFQTAIQEGAEYITIPEDEGARWIEAVQSVMANYVDKMVDRGFSEQEVNEWLTFIRDRIDHWAEEEGKYDIPSEAEIEFAVEQVWEKLDQLYQESK